jgi:hypothetical protein
MARALFPSGCRSRLLAVLLLSGLGGCQLEDLRPRQARVSVEGPAGTTVRMITSLNFMAAVDPQGVTRVSVTSSDTTYPTLPVDVSFQIREEQRFLVEVARQDEDVSFIRVRAFVNDSRKFEESGPLLEGAPYRFVYAFNQRLTTEVDVVF